MNKAKLIRFEKTDQGTVGIFMHEDTDFWCYTMELPWKNNSRNISCIPSGVYIAKRRWSKKYGHHFHITDVEGRSWILIHSGNYAGDVSKGYKTHSAGCILFGKTAGYIKGQRAVMNSRTAVRNFMNTVTEEFELTII